MLVMRANERRKRISVSSRFMNCQHAAHKRPKTFTSFDGQIDQLKLWEPLAMHRLTIILLLCVAYCSRGAAFTVDNDVSALHQEDELLKGLRVLYPEQNAQYKSPLSFRFQMITPDFSTLMAAYTGLRWLCLQLDDTWRRCIPIESGVLMIESINTGNHTARLVMFDTATPKTGKRLLQSKDVAFTVLSHEDFAASLKQQRLDDLALYGPEVVEAEEMNIVEWFQLRKSKGEDTAANHVMREVDPATGETRPITEDITAKSSNGSPTNPPLLVIGVKTRVIDGFPFRQAIRQTWASKVSLPVNIRVLFAACRIPVDASEEVRQAIAYEQKVYGGDLLTDVLDCEDSYAMLPQKVKEFLHYVGTDHVLRRAGYVMIADEDVYVRAGDFAEQLAALGPLTDLYAGHVKEGNAFLPERDPQRRYYLPESVYPLEEFPPFAWGPHYLMSMDVVDFIAYNREELQGLGCLDDVTIALWLLAIQVHPQHLAQFQNLRETPCTNELLVYADLGPFAMRIIHNNLNSGRSFCHGFNRHTWDKDTNTSIEIVYPLDGAVEKAPVAFKTQINLCVDQAEHYSEQYSGKYMCIETRDVNGAENTTTSCSQIGGGGVVVEHDTPGNFSVSAYIAANAQVASSSDERSWQSNTVYFSVVSGVDFDAQISDQIRQEGKLYPYFNLSIIEWAVQQQHRQDEKLLQRLAQDLNRSDVPMTLQPQGNGEDLILVIGIKTAVVTNFAIRQAIRQTWASKEALPAGVKVFFLGCRPFGKVGDKKLVYGDLLTDELNCDDSYADLPGKIKEFLHFTATKYAQAQYVMIADDDVYVRVDRVVQQLITKTPTLRFYSGQVRAIDNAQKAKVIRRNDGKYRYSLSKEEYPMSDLPPLAIGAYFFLSMDCVEFVSKNRKRLMNMAGMDDMSVALWMLVIQVHAQPFGNLEHLRGGRCTDNLVVLGDLSPLSIRVVHNNLLQRRQLCHGFNYPLWIKPENLRPSARYSRLTYRIETLVFEFSLRDPTTTVGLEVTSIISTDSLAGIKLLYFPALETRFNHFRRMCGLVRLNFPSAARKLSCHEISRNAQDKLQTYYEDVNGPNFIDLSRVELWRYNLFDTDVNAPPFIVAYTLTAAFSRVLLECLFVSVFAEQKRPLLVIPEKILHLHYRRSPDVFVFSILDGKCNPVSNPASQKMIADYFERYRDHNSNQAASRNRSTQLMMLSGEAWSTDGLDQRVILISTLASANRTKHVYLPMASTSFAERLDHEPKSLLSASESNPGMLEKLKFCAYLYARCDSSRELMYDLLNALRPVDALGTCAGSSRPPDSTKMASRVAMFYNDDAVRRYAPYKFVIAFENARAPDTSRRRCLSGDSTSVSQLFNPASFIDCGLFDSLQKCAEFVVYVDDSPKLYTRMRQERPVTNMTAYYQAFSWHPAVTSRFMADAVLQYLVPL
ncbi:Glycosyl transferase, family 31 [Phytophthora cactorum]|nr:Glycosyl transferase, family 31 [Phytophthora cactorum]